MSNQPTKAPLAEAGPSDSHNEIYMRALAKRFGSIDEAVAEIAHLRAILELPRGTVHVVSDVHGEFKKLKHIINNASGALRPLVEQTFGDTLTDGEKHELLTLIYYPRETYARIEARFADRAAREDFLVATIRREFDLIRELACRYSVKELERVFPVPHRQLFYELLLDRQLQRTASYVRALLRPFVDHGKDQDLLRATAHTIRNLLIYELVVAGDLGDRGPRIDRVIDYIMRQPRVTITWGNHDVTWMGACLGHEASIATVLRISLRYRRLSQLEEGYGIPMAPLERLVRDVYPDDPAERFACRGEGLRDPLLMSRMQKAMAIMQFKLEGQAVRRNPEYAMDHRLLLHHIDPEKGTVEVDGVSYPMRDMHLPTVDWSDPYRLSADEQACMDRLKQSFLLSPALWQQMRFVARRGATYARRDGNLIFHGCVPVDSEGRFLGLVIDGVEYRGRAMFDAVNRQVQLAFRDRDQKRLDFLWYLWTGPVSPLFGKDRMATFETYFIADKATHKETKNPYFNLIHTPEFCRTVMRDFGVTAEDGLIVNGHVPVKIEQGESPLKTGGLAVTIDGAFSEAYGDRGYTLVIRAGRVFLAQHHHFESVEQAITDGADIIPSITEIRAFASPHTVAESETGPLLEQEIAVLEMLIEAYRNNVISEQTQ